MDERQPLRYKENPFSKQAIVKKSKSSQASLNTSVTVAKKENSKTTKAAIKPTTPAAMKKASTQSRPRSSHSTTPPEKKKPTSKHGILKPESTKSSPVPLLVPSMLKKVQASVRKSKKAW